MVAQAVRSEPFASLRARLRKVRAISWAAAVARFLTFKVRLASADRAYNNDPAARQYPPPKLRYRVHGDLQLANYIAVGRSVAQTITDLARRHGLSLRGNKILDFACGPGRVAMFLKPLASDSDITGSDIDQEAISWASANLPHVGAFVVNDMKPPSRFRSEEFDLIYSISLFTHLSESSQLLWLQELHRLLKPEGIAVLTIHGEACSSMCETTEMEALRKAGFVFRVGNTGMLKLDGLPDSYQTAFHSRAYIDSVWTKWFEILEYVPGGLHGHQDVIVLRRTPNAS